MKKLLKVFLHPFRAYSYFMRSVRGYCYKGLYKLLCRRVTIGRNFKVDGSLSIQGPGRVIIGDNVTIGMHVTPWTHTEAAVLRIGNNVFLNGTRFGCADSIIVGDGCILADCRIMDTDYHGTDPQHRDVVKTAPIIIKENVWITMQCVVLKGVIIAEGCAVTPNSVVNRTLDTPNSIYGGNPAVFIKKAI